jgi:hypothetical protein
MTALLVAGGARRARAEAAAVDAPTLVPEAVPPPPWRLQAEEDLETGRDMRTWGIVLVTVAAVHIAAGIVLIALDPTLCGAHPPRYPTDDPGGCGFPFFSVVGGATAGAGLLLYGIPGTALWIAGNKRIDRARGIAPPASTGWSLGGGPSGSHGLSLRWRF